MISGSIHSLDSRPPSQKTNRSKCCPGAWSASRRRDDFHISRSLNLLLLEQVRSCLAFCLSESRPRWPYYPIRPQAIRFGCSPRFEQVSRPAVLLSKMVCFLLPQLARNRPECPFRISDHWTLAVPRRFSSGCFGRSTHAIQPSQSAWTHRSPSNWLH